MSRSLVFVHGWGFDASVWSDIISHLPEFSTTSIELGFMGESTDKRLEICDKTVIVAHSLGVMWALEHMSKPPQGLVSICGFDRFSPPVPRKDLLLMKRGLMKNPAAQMGHFWRSCGIAPFVADEALDQRALLDGLDHLMTGDVRTGRNGLACPIHVLAARNDQIVPEAMSKDMWENEQIQWSKEGGHALPLTRSRWCAEQIRHFIENNE